MTHDELRGFIRALRSEATYREKRNAKTGCTDCIPKLLSQAADISEVHLTLIEPDPGLTLQCGDIRKALQLRRELEDLL